MSKSFELVVYAFDHHWRTDMLAIRTSRPFFLSRPGNLLIIAAACAVGVTLLLPYTSLGILLELNPPSWTLLVAIAVIATIYVTALEIGKWIYRVAF